jgi:hypothetical protein
MPWNFIPEYLRNPRCLGILFQSIPETQDALEFYFKASQESKMPRSFTLEHLRNPRCPGVLLWSISETEDGV